MSVIETKIPIVEIQHHDEPSFSGGGCSKSKHHLLCRNFWNDRVPTRALLLCHGNDEGNRINHMPVQLSAVMTIDAYNAFCTTINEWIQQHDIAAAARRSKVRTDELSLKITYLGLKIIVRIVVG
jgi:hypothetical protein